jgi:hypothetical protein
MTTTLSFDGKMSSFVNFSSIFIYARNHKLKKIKKFSLALEVNVSAMQRRKAFPPRRWME